MDCTSAQRPRTLDSRRGLRPARRGVAMLLVLGVVGMGSVLGYAMLSSAAMQKQATTSASAIAGAQGLAESGVNLAIYYLQHPDKSPTYPAAYPDTATYDRQKLYWTGTDGKFVDFGSPSVGSVKVAVDRPDPMNRWKYRITSSGRAPGSTLERKVVATVQINAEYRLDADSASGVGYAAMFTNDAAMSMHTIIGPDQSTGNVYSNAGLGIRLGGVIVGTKNVRRKPMSTQVTYSWVPAPRLPKIVPNFDEIRSYMTYAFPEGTENQATVLTITDIGPEYPIKRLDPTTANPAGVYYVPGDLKLHGGAVINGTLIVEGKLTIISGVLGSEVKLRQAQPGFPALIVKGQIYFPVALSVAPVIRIDGLTYVGESIDGAELPLTGGLLPLVEINGALLVNGTAPVYMTLTSGQLRVNYNRDLADVPDFTEVGRTRMSINVKSWDAR